MHTPVLESFTAKNGAETTVKFVSCVIEKSKPEVKLNTLTKDIYIATAKPYTVRVDSGTRVKLGNGKVFSAGELLKKACQIPIAEKEAVKKPFPVVNKNGEITSNIKIYAPRTKKGPLSGKKIIINAGHGGYDRDSGAFDMGAHPINSDGKRVEEWYKNQKFVKELIPKLTSQGAEVIYLDGTAATVMAAKNKYKRADLFVSLHCDASPTNPKLNGQTVIYKNSEDEKLAQSIEKELHKYKSINAKNCHARADVRNLGVFKSAPQMPTVIVEAGFVTNAHDLKNIDSRLYRKKFATYLTKAIDSFLNRKK